MAFRVEISNLIAIASFIQTSEPALRWFEGLEAMILSLEEMPERGTSLPAKSRYRQVVYGSYRILYRVDKRKRCVYVVHVRHGARAGTGL